MSGRFKDLLKVQTMAQKSMKNAIAANRARINDSSFASATSKVPAVSNKQAVQPKRILRGHTAKVYAISWAADNTHLASVSQDGSLIIWDANMETKTNRVDLRSTWVMTCSYSPDGGMVAAGGLDNICTIYDIRAVDDNGHTNQRELNAHSGYLSCARFLSNESILTASGDTTIMRWDVASGVQVNIYRDHFGDVMSVSPSKDKSQFVSGATDGTCKIWDMRVPQCVQTLSGHDSDVNSVDWLESDRSFVSASDDGTCRLWDIRSDKELHVFRREQNTPVTEVAASISGRLMFASYDDAALVTWDLLKGVELGSTRGHSQRVSCLARTPDGTGLATGSWDETIKVWA